MNTLCAFRCASRLGCIFVVLGSASLSLAQPSVHAVPQQSAPAAAPAPGVPSAPAPSGSTPPFPAGLPSPMPNPAGLPSPLPPNLASPGTPPGSPPIDAGVAPLPSAPRAFRQGAVEPPPAAGPGPYTALQIAQSFIAADANRDGELTRAEAQQLAIMPASFEDMDRNHDGVLSRSEYEAAFEH